MTSRAISFSPMLAAGFLFSLEHPLVRECAKQAKGRRLVQPHMSRELAHRPLWMLEVERLEHREGTLNGLRPRVGLAFTVHGSRLTVHVLPIAARYARSHAAGTDSREENGPGRYMRDDTPS